MQLSVVEGLPLHGFANGNDTWTLSFVSLTQLTLVPFGTYIISFPFERTWTVTFGAHPANAQRNPSTTNCTRHRIRSPPPVCFTRVSRSSRASQRAHDTSGQNATVSNRAPIPPRPWKARGQGRIAPNVTPHLYAPTIPAP